MNQSYRHNILLIILIVSGMINGSQAQSRYDSGFVEIAKKHPENLVVFTDRTLYAVNESIQFSALLLSGGKPYTGVGSKVMYAELVSSTGNALAKGKFLIRTCSNSYWTWKIKDWIMTRKSSYYLNTFNDSGIQKLKVGNSRKEEDWILATFSLIGNYTKPLYKNLSCKSNTSFNFFNRIRPFRYWIFNLNITMLRPIFFMCMLL